MQKILAIVLTIIFTMTIVVGCGNSEESTSATNTDASSAGQDVEETVDSSNDVQEPTLTPEEYINTAVYFVNDALNQSLTISKLGSYISIDLVTPNIDVLDYGFKQLESNDGITQTDIDNAVVSLYNTFEELMYVPEDDLCQKWYDNLIYPASDLYIQLYNLVITNEGDYQAKDDGDISGSSDFMSILSDYINEITDLTNTFNEYLSEDTIGDSTN